MIIAWFGTPVRAIELIRSSRERRSLPQIDPVLVGLSALIYLACTVVLGWRYFEWLQEFPPVLLVIGSVLMFDSFMVWMKDALEEGKKIKFFFNFAYCASMIPIFLFFVTSYDPK